MRHVAVPTNAHHCLYTSYHTLTMPITASRAGGSPNITCLDPTWPCGRLLSQKTFTTGGAAITPAFERTAVVLGPVYLLVSCAEGPGIVGLPDDRFDTEATGSSNAKGLSNRCCTTPLRHPSKWDLIPWFEPLHAALFAWVQGINNSIGGGFRPRTPCFSPSLLRRPKSTLKDNSVLPLNSLGGLLCLGFGNRLCYTARTCHRPWRRFRPLEGGLLSRPSLG